MGRPVTVAVAVLVLLAGCGSASHSAGTETVTPAPVPTPAPTGSPTPAPTPSLGSTLPPGVAESGVVNLNALVRAHRSALNGRSYRTVSTVNRSTPGGWERSHRVVRVEGDRVHLVRESRTGGGNRSRRVQYADERRRYVRCGTADRGDACPTSPASAIDGDAAGTVLTLLSGTESSVVGTETRVAGTDRGAERLRYRVVVTGTPDAVGSPYGVVEVRNYSATALVAPSGLVSELEASYDVLAGGNRTRVTVRLRFTDFGTTRVTPPPRYPPNGAVPNGTVDPTEG